MTAPTPTGDPLTADKVADLAEGAEVVVQWSGGNGPHRYVVAVDRFGRRYVWDGRSERLRYYNPLRFVGRERFRTRVWPAPLVSRTGHQP